MFLCVSVCVSRVVGKNEGNACCHQNQRVHRKQSAESGAVTCFLFFSLYTAGRTDGMKQLKKKKKLIVVTSCVKKNTAENVEMKMFSSKSSQLHPHRSKRESRSCRSSSSSSSSKSSSSRTSSSSSNIFSSSS